MVQLDSVTGISNDYYNQLDRFWLTLNMEQSSDKFVKLARSIKSNPFPTYTEWASRNGYLKDLTEEGKRRVKELDGFVNILNTQTDALKMNEVFLRRLHEKIIRRISFSRYYVDRLKQIQERRQHLSIGRRIKSYVARRP